jgi:hypothetical protein
MGTRAEFIEEPEVYGSLPSPAMALKIPMMGGRKALAYISDALATAQKNVNRIADTLSNAIKAGQASGKSSTVLYKEITELRDKLMAPLIKHIPSDFAKKTVERAEKELDNLNIPSGLKSVWLYKLRESMKDPLELYARAHGETTMAHMYGNFKGTVPGNAAGFMLNEVHKGAAGKIYSAEHEALHVAQSNLDQAGLNRVTDIITDGWDEGTFMVSLDKFLQSLTDKAGNRAYLDSQIPQERLTWIYNLLTESSASKMRVLAESGKAVKNPKDLTEAISIGNWRERMVRVLRREVNDDPYAYKLYGKLTDEQLWKAWSNDAKRVYSKAVDQIEADLVNWKPKNTRMTLAELHKDYAKNPLFFGQLETDLPTVYKVRRAEIMNEWGTPVAEGDLGKFTKKSKPKVAETPKVEKVVPIVPKVPSVEEWIASNIKGQPKLVSIEVDGSNVLVNGKKVWEMTSADEAKSRAADIVDQLPKKWPRSVTFKKAKSAMAANIEPSATGALNYKEMSPSVRAWIKNRPADQKGIVTIDVSDTEVVINGKPTWKFESAEQAKSRALELESALPKGGVERLWK